ncbi:3'-5' exonuclease [Gloeobacter kilaueensis]|uniref:3'-5' exonuclease n=1 Tax=Gloeobacter kilaueensis (strain ATCC BAA-2537 / CCAP 1431/1 / ULC 316 / JS1) TaxID=1183438 RepID=U5QIK5_GLOK1|nr:3'-5' exonuclease [Gloeobacter kilaueensis]AGY58766.1 3'-5' exonuclease [Gloeobacter kilaueensis JS1]
MGELAAVHIFSDDLSESVAEVYLTSEHLAVDTEAMGLLPQRDRLCLVQLCDSTGLVSVVRIPQGLKQAPQLKRVLEASGPVKLFHYARFDVAMLRYHLGIYVQPIVCTKVASKLARTYSPRHGLKDLIAETVGVELDKSAQSSDWGAVLELTDEQLRYAANDVRYLIPAWHKLESMLRREGRLDLALRCFAFLPTQVELDLLGYLSIFEH